MQQFAQIERKTKPVRNMSERVAFYAEKENDKRKAKEERVIRRNEKRNFQ